ncbi:MAG: DUF5990 family protein [Vitreoscilla sp.]
MQAIALQLIYDGAGPVHWQGGADAFGLQDRQGALHPGTPGAAGALVFDFTLQVKSLDSTAAVLAGEFAHGGPAERFVYLAWRNAGVGFAQRLKLPLFTITSDQVREALDKGRPLTATLVDHDPRATATGANIGGARTVDWILA